MLASYEKDQIEKPKLITILEIQVGNCWRLWRADYGVLVCSELLPLGKLLLDRVL